MLIATGGSGLVATLKNQYQSLEREREAEKNTACVRYREIEELSKRMRSPKKRLKMNYLLGLFTFSSITPCHLHLIN